MKLLAIIVSIIFVLLIIIIWLIAGLVGAAKDFWSVGIVQFMVACFMFALIGSILVILKKINAPFFVFTGVISNN